MTVSFPSSAPSGGTDCCNLPVQNISTPRFTLRQRPARKDVGAMNLSSYNSDFLSGLFADVAKVAGPREEDRVGPECLGAESDGANMEPPSPVPSKRRSGLISTAFAEEDGSALLPRRRCDRLVSQEMLPNKRSRLSITRCLSVARPSCANLSAMASGSASPKGIADFFARSVPASGPLSGSVPALEADSNASVKDSLPHQDSLALQLHCIGSVDADADASASCPSSELPDAQKVVSEAADVVFPHLPATVSNSSCTSGLTRSKVDLPVSTAEADNKEAFGWFVDLDDDAEDVPAQPIDALAVATGSADLAFTAYTAPKRINDEAELEWAKAADTVDDVLGDFF